MIWASRARCCIACCDQPGEPRPICTAPGGMTGMGVGGARVSLGGSMASGPFASIATDVASFTPASPDDASPAFTEGADVARSIVSTCGLPFTGRDAMPPIVVDCDGSTTSPASLAMGGTAGDSIAAMPLITPVSTGVAGAEGLAGVAMTRPTPAGFGSTSSCSSSSGTTG